MEKKLQKLLQDFDYEYSGKYLTRKGIKGFCSSEIVSKFRDIQSAAEWLCPIVKDDNYTKRLNKLTGAIEIWMHLLV